MYCSLGRDGIFHRNTEEIAMVNISNRPDFRDDSVVQRNKCSHFNSLCLCSRFFPKPGSSRGIIPKTGQIEGRQQGRSPYLDKPSPRRVVVDERLAVSPAERTIPIGLRQTAELAPGSESRRTIDIPHGESHGNRIRRVGTPVHIAGTIRSSPMRQVAPPWLGREVMPAGEHRATGVIEGC